MSWIDALPEKKRRGSLPRCLQLMSGNSEEVSKRLTDLIRLESVVITPDCKWMPLGKPFKNNDGKWDLSNTSEAELNKSEIIENSDRDELTKWWFGSICNYRTPNFDIVSSCLINGKRGIVLVEAKAHDTELLKEAQGKILVESANSKQKENHQNIDKALREANNLLGKIHKGFEIGIDSHYQLSNRFAWSWKLASMGIPVVLVYLGFLNADEMKDIGTPFNSDNEWRKCVLNHSKGVIPEEVWEQDINIKDTVFIPVIRSIDIKLAENYYIG